MYKNEKVLRWENILWDDGIIHVPPGVAKTTPLETGSSTAKRRPTTMVELLPANGRRRCPMFRFKVRQALARDDG